MNNLIIKNIFRFIVLIFFQISILNNVYLGGYANPFIYILFILMLPTNMNKIAMLLVSFAAGLSVDIFSCSLGFHSFAATLVAFARITFADRILTKDKSEEIDTPSVKTIAFSTYIIFVMILTFIYCFAYYSIEAFCIFDIFNVFIRSILSTCISSAFMIACEFLFISQKKKV